MLALKSQHSMCNIQTLKLPLSIYSDFSKCQYAFVLVNDLFKVLTKIELIDEPLLFDCCFIDSSVIKPCLPWPEFDFRRMEEPYGLISRDQIHCLEDVNFAKFVEIIIVTSNITCQNNIYKGKNKINGLLCDLLKPFVISKGCIVMLNKLSKSAFLNCYCLIINNLPGKEDVLFAVNDSTNIVINIVLSFTRLKQMQYLQSNKLFEDIFVSEPKVGTLNRAYNYVTNLLSLSKAYGSIASSIKPEKNLLIVGQPGCGKYSLLNTAATKMGFNVKNVACGDIIMVPVASALNKLNDVFEEGLLYAQNKEPCIIFLKDIDLICEVKNNDLTQRSNFMIHALSDLLDSVSDKPGIAVYASSNSHENIDERLRRIGRISEELEIPMLSEEDRENCLKKIAKPFGIRCDDEVARKIAKWTPGFVLADIISLMKEAKYLLEVGQVHDIQTQERCYKKAVSLTVATAVKGMRGLTTSGKTSFSDIGGLESVKKLLQVSVLWQMSKPEAFARLGIPPTKGILLYGPPGCAKTTLVKALASESNATFLAMSSADLYSPYVGESEKRLVKLFSQARIAAPAIIFIDEIDALMGNRNGLEKGVQERLLATLLVEMDGVGTHVLTLDSATKIAEGQPTHANPTTHGPNPIQSLDVIVIGATNRPELIDDALKRPGRFDKLIFIPPPDETERFAILKTVTRKMSLGSDVDLKVIAGMTENFSGADLKGLCNDAALRALSTRGMETPFISANDFNEVLKSFVPSLVTT